MKNILSIFLVVVIHFFACEKQADQVTEIPQKQIGESETLEAEISEMEADFNYRTYVCSTKVAGIKIKKAKQVEVLTSTFPITYKPEE